MLYCVISGFRHKAGEILRSSGLLRS